MVDSVLAAQAHARPKPPVLVARKDGASPRSPSKPRPPPAGSPPKKASVARDPIPANELLKKRPAAPAAASAASPIAFVLTVVAGNGRGQRYRVPVSGCWIGRNRGNILFPEDSFVSAHHATLIVHEGMLRVRDEGSASGVFVAIAGQETISHGAMFNIGRRLFRYLGHLPPAPTGGQPRVYGAPLPQGQTPYAVEEVLVGGRSGRAAISGAPVLTLGQMNCDLSFPQDDDLASRHCELAPVGQGALLRDLSGVLGTFVRMEPGSDRQLNTGDRIRVGQQILQVEAA